MINGSDYDVKLHSNRGQVKSNTANRIFLPVNCWKLPVNCRCLSFQLSLACVHI